MTFIISTFIKKIKKLIRKVVFKLFSWVIGSQNNMMVSVVVTIFVEKQWWEGEAPKSINNDSMLLLHLIFGFSFFLHIRDTQIKDYETMIPTPRKMDFREEKKGAVITYN